MHASSTQIEFWKIWTDYGLIVVQAAPLAIFYIIPKQRVRFFYYLVLFSFVMLVMNVTKLSYADPRPYWVASDIVAYKCSNQYGNPSGHSETSMGIAMTLWLDYAFTNASNLRKGVLLFAALLFAFSIGYSRLILGVHSLDQIIYGLSLGVWIAFTMQYCVRPDLDPHVASLLKNNAERLSDRFFANLIIQAIIVGG